MWNTPSHCAATDSVAAASAVTASYVLIKELGLTALHGECARAQVSALCDRLLKLSVWVERSVRSIVLHLSMQWSSLALTRPSAPQKNAACHHPGNTDVFMRQAGSAP